MLVVGCLACDVIAGRVASPGGTIYDGDHWRVTHSVSPVLLPGFLILAERQLIGAQDLSDVWIPLNRVTVRLNAVIATVLLVALLAGVMGQVARRLDQSGSADEQPDVVR